MTASLRRVSRILAFLLLVTQLGAIAHRVEHYILPDQMECGEDSCAAFMPVADPPALPVIETPAAPVLYSIRLWTIVAAMLPERQIGLGFRAHAPPA